MDNNEFEEAAANLNKGMQQVIRGVALTTCLGLRTTDAMPPHTDSQAQAQADKALPLSARLSLIDAKAYVAGYIECQRQAAAYPTARPQDQWLDDINEEVSALIGRPLSDEVSCGGMVVQEVFHKGKLYRVEITAGERIKV